MNALFLDDLIAAIGGEITRPSDVSLQASGVSIDSRTVQPGEVFWAIKGESHDGHNYLADAFARGAAAGVVEKSFLSKTRPKQECFPGPVIGVPDTLEALWKLSSWHRKQQDALIVGVTGSVGKTTTREAIHAVLKTNYHGIQSPKNFNNHIGVPLSLLQIANDHEFAVLEMGASAQGEIHHLTSLATPEVGVVTAIGQAHLAGFGSIENIVQAKGELIELLPSTGFAVLNGDDPFMGEIASRASCPVIFVGEQPHNQLRATEVRSIAGRLEFRVDGHHYTFPAVGRHHLTSALAAIAIGREIGMAPRSIAHGLNMFRPVSGRCCCSQIGRWTVIDDTYNANPRSMRAACELLRDWPEPSKKMLVLGDMLELGAQTTDYHHELGRWVSECRIDHLIAFGDQAEHIIRGAREQRSGTHQMAQCGSLDALFVLLDCWLEPGSIVLVKGSRGLRMERIVAWLRERAERDRLMEHENSRKHSNRDDSRICA